jgi:hypothetical protein
MELMWKARNDIVFNDRACVASDILSRAASDLSPGATGLNQSIGIA